MVFSKSITQIIEERTSWRTYKPILLEDDLKEQINSILKLENIQSPFNSENIKCRFELIEIPQFDPEEKQKIGTYGIIKGAQQFIVGATEKTYYDKENYGYLLETIILRATELGLGTCWLGGFFNRSLFSKKIRCKPNEIVPAITPIGYPAEKRRLKEKVIRSMVKAKQRLPWRDIFFSGTFNSPIDRINLGKYETALEMVRLGPSAGNKQSWRIIKENDKNIYHFYAKFSDKNKSSVYNKFVRLDIGIAVCHFDLTANELGLKGRWEFLNPDIVKPKSLKYTISWNGT